MGETLSCCLGRDKFICGKIRFITKDEFQEESGGDFIALDCSVDSFDGKILAETEY